MKSTTSIIVLCILFFLSAAQSDNVKDLGPGFLNIPYQVGDNLPSRTLPAGMSDQLETQVLTFEFSAPVSGKAPSSFRAHGNPRINTFVFIPPMDTQFHFVALKSELTGCGANAEPTVAVHGESASQRKVLAAGESVGLNRGQPAYITFDLKNWSGCTFSELKFEYFLAGKVSSYQTEARPTWLTSRYDAVKSEFFTELTLPKIYSPIFRYEAVGVSAPLMEKDLSMCEFRNKASWVYDGGPYTTKLQIRFSCENLSGEKFQAVEHRLENIGLVVTDLQAVLSQYQTMAPPRTTDQNWYVDRNLPVYSYRSVELTSFVFGASP